MKKHIFSISGLLYVSFLMAQNSKPNIVLILADDMRSSTLGVMDVEGSHTPMLNQLAGEGIVYSNTHIMGGTNGAVSMPSRAMLMTGRYQYNLEKQGALLPESHVTLGETLQEAGYDTYHIGKWHNDKSSFNRCFNGGNDIFFGGMADHWNVPLFHYDPTGEYRNKRKYVPEFKESNQTQAAAGEYCHSGIHSVDVFTESAINFIKGREGEDKPFFLSLCYMSPHDPRTMPQEYSDLYPAHTIGLPPNFMERHPFDNGELAVRDEKLASIPRQEAEIQQHIADYYAMISHLDARIGDFLQVLAANGMYENTVVVFAADNGLAVGQHGLMGKQNLYEHSLNVPLIIKPAGEKQPSAVNDRLCYLLDLYPAICEMADAQLPESCEGISLLSESGRDFLYYGYRDFQRAVYDGRWKLIVYRVNGIETRQLFDIKSDPFETVNLVNDPKQRKTAKKLWSEMLRQKEITNDNSSFWE